MLLTTESNFFAVVKNMNNSGLKPKKPPRRNHSISPVAARNHWESEGYDDSSSACSKKPKAPRSVYSSKSGSKSFDELDDILSDKPKKQLSKKRGRRTLSTISGTDLQKAREQRDTWNDDFSCQEGEDMSYVLNNFSNRTLNDDNSNVSKKYERCRIVILY